MREIFVNCTGIKYLYYINFLNKRLKKQTNKPYNKSFINRRTSELNNQFSLCFLFLFLKTAVFLYVTAVAVLELTL